MHNRISASFESPIMSRGAQSSVPDWDDALAGLSPAQTASPQRLSSSFQYRMKDASPEEQRIFNIIQNIRHHNGRVSPDQRQILVELGLPEEHINALAGDRGHLKGGGGVLGTAKAGLVAVGGGNPYLGAAYIAGFLVLATGIGGYLRYKDAKQALAHQDGIMQRFLDLQNWLLSLHDSSDSDSSDSSDSDSSGPGPSSSGSSRLSKTEINRLAKACNEIIASSKNARVKIRTLGIEGDAEEYALKVDNGIRAFKDAVSFLLAKNPSFRKGWERMIESIIIPPLPEGYGYPFDPKFLQGASASEIMEHIKPLLSADFEANFTAQSESDLPADLEARFTLLTEERTERDEHVHTSLPQQERASSSSTQVKSQTQESTSKHLRQDKNKGKIVEEEIRRTPQPLAKPTLRQGRNKQEITREPGMPPWLNPAAMKETRRASQPITIRPNPSLVAERPSRQYRSESKEKNTTDPQVQLL